MTPRGHAWPGSALRRVVLAGLAGCIAAAAPGCRDPETAAAPVSPGAVLPLPSFRDVTGEAGIRFRHVNGAFGKKWIPETMGSGCGFFDYDNDGRLDIYLANSTYWPGHRGAASPSPALYRNVGSGRFRDVTREAGLELDFYGMGVASGDYDGDGYEDLFLTGLNDARLLRNDGGRRFRDVTPAAPIRRDAWSTSAAWLDYDRDGDLDLFVCYYIRWSPATDLFWTLDGIHKTYATPIQYAGESCRLYRNEGAGPAGEPRFTDVTRAAGIESAQSKALGVAICDYDQDGRPDIAVSNDTVPNFLYHNQGDGTFKEVAGELGVAFSEAGRAKAGMGIDTADVGNDGRETILVTNFSGEQLALYQRDDTGLFLDIAARAGVGPASQLFLGFGAFFFDPDLDGWQDILVANGHIQDDIGIRNTGVTYAEPPLLFRSLGGGRFVEVSRQAGGLAQSLVARGACYGDYDDDGDPDVLITTNHGEAHLLNCAGSPRNHWLRVTLRGEGKNRAALGARIRLTVGRRVLTRMVRGGSSYLSQSDRRPTFGLGPATAADRIEIQWPDGSVQLVGPQAADATVVITEGEPEARRDARPGH